ALWEDLRALLADTKLALPPRCGIGTPRAILLLDNLHRWPVAVGLCAQLFHDGEFQRRDSPFRVAFSYSSADPNGFRQAEGAIEGLVNKFESTYLLHEPLTRLPTPRADPLPYFHLLYHHDPPRTFAPGVDDEDKNTCFDDIERDVAGVPSELTNENLRWRI